MSPSGPTPLPATSEGAGARPLSWYRRMYLRVEALSTSRHAVAAMLVVSVIDASFFPIPPFALLIPMVLAKPSAWWRLAVGGTVASLFGGLIGYWMGGLVHSGAASFLPTVDLSFRITRFGIDATLGELLGKNFWFLALLCSVLPTPFKVVAIGSGFVGVPLGQFMLAAVIGRTARFFGVAGAMAFVGPKARKWLRV